MLNIVELTLSTEMNLFDCALLLVFKKRASEKKNQRQKWRHEIPLVSIKTWIFYGRVSEEFELEMKMIDNHALESRWNFYLTYEWRCHTIS